MNLCKKTPTPLNFIEWQQDNFRSVNKFYNQQKHKGRASANERIFVAMQMDADEPIILAALRLVPYDNFYWLRSLYVDNTRQGQGLGSQLLTAVHTAIESPIYCFPYSHLENFYSRAGYSHIDSQALPEALQALYARYNRKSDHLLVMQSI